MSTKISTSPSSSSIVAFKNADQRSQGRWRVEIWLWKFVTCVQLMNRSCSFAFGRRNGREPASFVKFARLWRALFERGQKAYGVFSIGTRACFFQLSSIHLFYAERSRFWLMAITPFEGRHSAFHQRALRSQMPS